MATLTGNSVASTYKQLLKVTSEGIGADASAKFIEDGLGTDSALSISTTRVGIGTASPTRTLDVTSNVVHSVDGLTSQLTVRGTADSTQKLNIGYDTTNNYGFIEAVDESVAWQNLSLQPSGGNVGINETSPAHKLEVGGDIGVAGNYLLEEQGRQNHVANTMPAPYYRFDGVDDVINLDALAVVLAVASNTKGAIAFRGTVDILANTNAWGFGDTNADAGIHSEIRSDGKIRIKMRASAWEIVSDDALITAGVEFHYVVVHDGTSPSLYFNGSSVSITNLVSTDLTEWFGNETGIDNGRIGAFNFNSSGNGGFTQETLKGFSVWNKALTATEVKELYSGASVPYKYKGANQTSVVVGDNSDFDTVGNWVNYAGGTDTIVGDFDGGGGTGFMEWNNGSATSHAMRLNGFLTAGKKYRVTATIQQNTGTGDIGFANQRVVSIADENKVVFNTTTGTVTYSGEFLSTSSDFFISSADANEGEWVIDNLLVVPIGAVAEYDGSGIASDKWFDKSGNDLHGAVTGASVENAPTGDDGLVYEEGEFDIGFTDPAGDIVVNASYNVGAYTRIGRVVHAQGNIRFSSGTASGDIILTGLPYTRGDFTDSAEIVNVSIYMDGLASAIDGYVSGVVSGTSIYLRETGTTGSGNDLGVHVDSGTTITFQATYMID